MERTQKTDDERNGDFSDEGAPLGYVAEGGALSRASGRSRARVARIPDLGCGLTGSRGGGNGCVVGLGVRQVRDPIPRRKQEPAPVLRCRTETRNGPIGRPCRSVAG